jgi:hypothetical protein
MATQRCRRRRRGLAFGARPFYSEPVMRGVRRYLTRASGATAALFALTLAAPRPELVHHSHGHGERQHVHAERDPAWLKAFFAELRDRHRHQPRAHHHDHDHDHHAAGWQTRDDAPAGHWHAQQRYHRAAVSTPTALIGPAPLAVPLVESPPPPTRLAAVAAAARGPPPLSRSA